MSVRRLSSKTTTSTSTAVPVAADGDGSRPQPTSHFHSLIPPPAFALGLVPPPEGRLRFACEPQEIQCIRHKRRLPTTKRISAVLRSSPKNEPVQQSRVPDDTGVRPPHLCLAAHKSSPNAPVLPIFARNHSARLRR